MIRKLKKITPEQYLKKVFARRREIQAAQTAIAKLEQQWINEYCPVQVGHAVKIDKTAQGHTEFLIQRIHVDVEQGLHDKSDQDKFSIQFSFTGLFRGEGVEDLKVRTRFNHVKSSNENAEPKPETL